MEIDRKFRISACHSTKGTTYTHENSVLFLAKDKVLPGMLQFYYNECEHLGVEEAQLEGIRLLIQRVERYQKENFDKTKLPDIDPGKEQEYVNRPNPK